MALPPAPRPSTALVELERIATEVALYLRRAPELEEGPGAKWAVRQIGRRKSKRSVTCACLDHQQPRLVSCSSGISAPVI